MSELLSDRTAVVTGGSSGNGRAIAKTFAEHGADVVVADVREDPRLDGAPTHEWIRDHTNASADFVDCDVRKPDDFEPVMERAAELGGVDAMVNNAGIVGDFANEFAAVSPDSYAHLLRVNIDGVFFGAQAAATRMLEADREGSIVNMSSFASIRGSPGGGSTVYALSKGAIHSFTYSLAAELGPLGIRVNSLHPGFHETAMTIEDTDVVGTESGEALLQRIPLRRWGTPQDVANAALFLSSELSGYVTAESLSVDGGVANTL
jgi:NAD(P)-dependent dehydrogenase (short-subunit alcohol dehydrogenase family)